MRFFCGINVFWLYTQFHPSLHYKILQSEENSAHTTHPLYIVLCLFCNFLKTINKAGNSFFIEPSQNVRPILVAASKNAKTVACHCE